MRLRPCRIRERLKRTLLATRDALAAYGSMSASAKLRPEPNLETVRMAQAVWYLLFDLVYDAGVKPESDIPSWVPAVFEAVRERVNRDTATRNARISRQRRRTGR
jgi:hypothetical protein